MKTKAGLKIKQISILGSNLLLMNPCLNKKAIFISKLLYARFGHEHLNEVVPINRDNPFIIISLI